MCQGHAVARLRPALGTFVAIEARAVDAARALRAVEAGYAALHKIDRLLHPTRSWSELARLNRSPPGRLLPVARETAEVLRLSRELCAVSDGYFEPAIPGGGSVLNWRPVAARSIAIDRRAWVDFGGIAKGYAVDLAIAALRTAGADAGLVNAGGDLRVFGPAPWPLSLRIGATEAALSLRDAALAASVADHAARPPEHRGYYGRAAARPGLPPRSAAVIAPTAALADALTKIAMHGPPALSARLLARYGARAFNPGGPVPCRAPGTCSW